MAAHLHDSVLQTLALVQRRAEDPREVAALARRQERELRSWLSGRTEAADGRAAPGAAPWRRPPRRWRPPTACTWRSWPWATASSTPRREALVAAAREAMTNAAKFGAGAPVAVYAEAGGRPRAGVRARPWPGLRPGGRAARPPRRARVDRGADGAPRRPGPHHQPARRGHRGGAGAGMSGPRVVIVDDHGLFRAGVRAELEQLVEIAGDAGYGGRGRARRSPTQRARRGAAGRAHARRRRGGGDPPGRARAPGGALPGPVGLGRRRGRDRRDPRGRARLRDQDDLRRGAGRRRPPRARRRRRVLPAAGGVRARRVRRRRAPSRPGRRRRARPAHARASARCSSTSRAATCTRRSPTAWGSRPRPWRRTCRRCCASSSSPAATSCRAWAAAPRRRSEPAGATPSGSRARPATAPRAPQRHDRQRAGVVGQALTGHDRAAGSRRSRA